MEELRIVFMGTPEFAVPSLKILVDNGFNVVGVVTAPDKPKGRGQKLAESPVKVFAKEHEIQVLQPVNLKSGDFLSQLSILKANIQVVVAFRMLPEIIWSLPEFGTFNLHASLLPQYRGAAPINWAIINGESKTGVTTFFLKHEIDTGKIILQEEELITTTDTVGSLYERLMKRGANVVLKTIEKIAGGNVESKEQNEREVIKHAPKIYKETCEIVWNKSSVEIYNHIRGLSPYPGAWTKFDGKLFKIFSTKISSLIEELQPGQLKHSEDKIYVKTGDSMLELTEIQQEGKKRMLVKDFLKGNKISQ